jgi:hypothetical protein
MCLSQRSPTTTSSESDTIGTVRRRIALKIGFAFGATALGAPLGDAATETFLAKSSVGRDNRRHCAEWQSLQRVLSVLMELQTSCGAMPVGYCALTAWRWKPSQKRRRRINRMWSREILERYYSLDALRVLILSSLLS